MAEPTDSPPLPRVKVVAPKRRRISVVWIIPILAALVAVGIAVQRILREGPTITIVFTAAEGVEAGKTGIKYKDVIIGQVTAVHLADDYTKVQVTAKIDKNAAGLMVKDAKFWVVRPQITLSGVSGLSTLLSGNYIGFERGQSDERTRSFTGLDVAPIVTGQPGRGFVLTAAARGSLSIGSPVYYRELPVGQVTGYDLAAGGKTVRIMVFVNAPYDQYVVGSTRFWNVSGVDVSVGADGIDVRTAPLVALLVGGIAFDVPPFMTENARAAADATFTLYRDQTAAFQAPDPVARRYVLRFKESVRGLSVGAPVSLLGLNAGVVTDIGLSADQTTGDFRPEVRIVFYPERLTVFTGKSGDSQTTLAIIQDEQKRRALLRRMVEERGLRAQLKTGSLITGQLYISLDYHPGAPKVKVDWSREVLEVPVVPSTLADLEDKLASIVGKIDKMPLEAIGNDLKADLANLDQTLTAARRLISNADEQLVPGLKASLETLNKTLIAVERAASNADATLLQSSAPAQEELRAALREFAAAARSVRVLMNELERQPSSVIRGKPDSSSGGR